MELVLSLEALGVTEPRVRTVTVGFHARVYRIPHRYFSP